MNSLAYEEQSNILKTNFVKGRNKNNTFTGSTFAEVADDD
jgi:hypothetical protein